ncbi:hypothetical protein [Micrococcus sp.]|uniref:hypothetical protein n=1 Tax=Micrococcus sp. TaxID=1271 RepID=UPI0026DB3B7D|nr:hypothetical protein [Micrococcus sp.]MDO4240881.1 hypothetical protein [Micrococcus sp.]
MSRPSRRPAPSDPRPGFVSPWQNGSSLYRRIVLAGSGLFLLGIVLSVVGALTERLPLSWAALAILAVGVLVHLTAQTVRLREAGRRQAETGPGRSR